MQINPGFFFVLDPCFFGLLFLLSGWEWSVMVVVVVVVIAFSR